MTASFSAGTGVLTVFGDNLNNNIVISRDSAGDDPELKGELAVAQRPLTEEWEKERQDAVKTLREHQPLPPEVKDRLRDLARNNPLNAEVVQVPIGEPMASRVPPSDAVISTASEFITRCRPGAPSL